MKSLVKLQSRPRETSRASAPAKPILRGGEKRSGCGPGTP